MVMVTLELFLSLCETVLSFIFTIFYSGSFTFIVYIMKMVKLHKKLLLISMIAVLEFSILKYVSLSCLFQVDMIECCEDAYKKFHPD